MAVNTYGCFTITADADENIVPLIFKEYGVEPAPSLQKIKFIGFESDEGTKIKINNVPNEVPSNGKFITPYEDGNNCMKITSFSFDEGCDDLKIWVII